MSNYPDTLKEILSKYTNGSLIELKFFALNKEVNAHLIINNVGYVARDINPRKAVSSTLQRISEIEAELSNEKGDGFKFNIEFDPLHYFEREKGFKTKYTNRAILTLDRIYERMAFRNAKD